MPTSTTQPGKSFIERASSSNRMGAGGSPPGVSPAPPPEIREPSGLSRALVDEAVDRARLRSMLELPDGGEIPDEVVDQLLAGARTEEEIAGPGGVLAQLTKRLIERALEVELTEHVGYEPHCEPPGGAEDQRVWAYFESTAFPPRHRAEAVVACVAAARGPISEQTIET